MCSVESGLLKQILIIFQGIKHSILYGRKKTVGGLSISCRNDLCFKASEVSKSNFEVIKHVHVKLHSSNKKTINVYGMYRAPSHGVITQFLSEFEKIINTFSSREIKVLCGDISIELMKLDIIGKSYADIMFSSSLEQHKTLPTRLAGNSVKLIDLIWSNCPSTVHSGVFDTGIGDPSYRILIHTKLH